VSSGPGLSDSRNEAGEITTSMSVLHGVIRILCEFQAVSRESRVRLRMQVPKELYPILSKRDKEPEIPPHPQAV
jgi:hypothetical protein